MQNLLIVLFPLSALAVNVSTFAPATSSGVSQLNGGMVLHISSSILAYSVLTLATLQAAVLALQDHQLKHRHTRGIIQILPPLQSMEAMLFELLWIGLGLLSIAIVSGALFIDDIFAQSLVHKTVLTIAAWLLFATLLWGHYRLGWRSKNRGQTDSRGLRTAHAGIFWLQAGTGTHTAKTLNTPDEIRGLAPAFAFSSR